MLSIFRASTTAFFCLTSAAYAQETWLQVEARPNLSAAQESASDYAQQIEDVSGFELGSSGWYAIAIGPFSPDEAARERVFLQREGLIPGDAFTTDGGSFGDRFWPIGAARVQQPEPGSDAAGDQQAQQVQDDTAQNQRQQPGETREEALLGERRLDESARRKLQLALRRTGFYDGPIDAEFGRSTRSAMAAWQGENGAEATGVLTSAQREQLRAQYNEILAEAGPEEVLETPAEARRSESTLSRQERAALQEALEWEGYYDGPIDAAFGPGTRSAMGDWQEANGFSATGVLTTRQRRSLMEEYNSVLDGLGMEVVRDDTAGVEIIMPTGEVSFDRYEPPFAHYSDGTDAMAPRVLLISQRGDQDTLFGLYDIMQTLEMVPQEGERSRNARSFTLVGEGDDFVSHTEARLTSEGHVKGFSLIWPAGDEKRRGRVLDEMQQSFRPLTGIVMDDSIGAPDESQSVDLVSGLKVRKPERSRTGFYIDEAGAVLTTSDVLDQCDRITLNEDIEAQVAATDETLGLTLLTPAQDLSPIAYARFQTGVPRLQSSVAVAGYSFEGVLGAPSLSFGKVADLRDLSGDTTVQRLDVSARPGDAGGPVLNQSGAVLGMLLPGSARLAEGTRLPEGVAFAADVEAISEFLSGTGPAPAAAEETGRGDIGPEQLTRMAADMTVLVSCWK
ncbi:Peptidoglycan-binding (PGRP) domain of peptidoglycan hydrolases-containing protein [Tranquillimonas rosea]|uniref:Peptidoglycan-binding (PGRP) domain of peptidoglycan hydrolases-containing protein n=1 Tax=Tranquillimonas rosea TaxID=641238 RepID=A0A1H9WES8_9RHOB|nr:peptidoglycan-binding protein [Tranquillimonas rosea]SES32334.1 Peptidoglycan-binding (PGRP) domain of peptidoglycan hydrolases-containing protein [Tranquillimonas rosea]